MPRDIPVGNGHMLVCFDEHYRLRDLYYPRVGQENHAGVAPCRFGVFGDVIHPDPRREGKPERRRKRLYWSDDGWDTRLRYQDDSLATDVTMAHPSLAVALKCTDVVDFNRTVLVRRIDVVNQHDHDREVALLHHHDIAMYGTRIGDTAYYDPKMRSLVHYRGQRYLMACFYAHGEQRIDEYATGNAGWGGAEGTYRDAEDGRLGGNPIAQGAVDSTMLIRLHLPAHGSATVYLVLGCAERYDALEDLHGFVHREGPQGVIDRTSAYWRLWLAASRAEFPPHDQTGLNPDIEALFHRSLLVVRTQIDNGGAITAANDSDIMQFNRDTYSYLWPRDGAFVADAMDAAGFPHIARSFFRFCCETLEEGGYFLHKYNPDGSTASSWHPWVANGRTQLPIQEDETALVIWALWRHFVRYRDIETVRPMWASLIRPACDFMLRYRDPDTHLPLPSYDLWEERYGVHAFTVATVYGGLKAGWQFAVCFGDTKRAAAYAQAADDMKIAFAKHFWHDPHGRLVRRITPVDEERTARFMDDVIAGRSPAADLGHLDADPAPGDAPADPARSKPVAFDIDDQLDSSMFAIFATGLMTPDDPKLVATMDAIEQQLTVKTDVGGLARYRADYYHAVSDDYDRIPGNPWFICTLWLAQWHTARAHDTDALRSALPFLQWAVDHANPSGVLAEQAHPETGEPMSVCPLTWSHATVVATVVTYLHKFEDLAMELDLDAPLRTAATDALRARRLPQFRLTHDPVPELD